MVAGVGRREQVRRGFWLVFAVAEYEVWSQQSRQGFGIKEPLSNFREPCHLSIETQMQQRSVCHPSEFETSFDGISQLFWAPSH